MDDVLLSLLLLFLLLCTDAQMRTCICIVVAVAAGVYSKQYTRLSLHTRELIFH